MDTFEKLKAAWADEDNENRENVCVGRLRFLHHLSDSYDSQLYHVFLMWHTEHTKKGGEK